MTKELVLNKIMGLSSQAFTYSSPANAFIGKGFTSAAGNHYFASMRFSEGIIIQEDFGIGWKYQFINAIRIFSTNDRTMIADATFHNEHYTKERVQALATNMLMEKLRESAKREGYWFDEAAAMVTVREIVADAFRVNQMEMAEKQLKRLSA